MAARLRWQSWPPRLLGLAHSPAPLACASRPHSLSLSPPPAGDFDASADRAYNRSFATKAEKQTGNTAGAWLVGWAGRAILSCRRLQPPPVGPRCSGPDPLLPHASPLSPPHPPTPTLAGKMKALSKEVKGFSGRTKLPVYAASAICVRYDPGEPVRASDPAFRPFARPPAGLAGQAAPPALPCRAQRLRSPLAA